jgi:hypothetical protein
VGRGATVIGAAAVTGIVDRGVTAADATVVHVAKAVEIAARAASAKVASRAAAKSQSSLRRS